MKPAILFDLGNTLVSYYHAAEFGPILEQAIANVHRELSSCRRTAVTLEAALAAAARENREAADHRFRPMTERFGRIFDARLEDEPALGDRLCRLFLRPVFALARIYDDVLPVLHLLRRDGYPLGIVSNAPWGSPPGLWREELERLGLAPLTDAVVLCGDVGYRKPAAEIFRHAAQAVGRKPDRCVFAGDDPGWDMLGSEAVGMRPILVDRDRRFVDYDGARSDDLKGVVSFIEQEAGEC